MVNRDGKREAIHVPVPNCPIILIMPLFRMPRCCAEYPYEKGILFTGAILLATNVVRFQKEYDVESLYSQGNFRTSFARLLAKIAYGMTVVQCGLETIDEAYVLPSILGKKDDVGYWVGCSDDSKPPKILPEEKFLHRIDLTVSQVRKNNEVEARVDCLLSIRCQSIWLL